MNNWYQIQNENEIDSPALLVYPERIQHNIELAISMVGDVNRLRPHVKTYKTKEILALQLAAGITRFKCATIAEAEMLGEGGAPDVLLAYPLLQPKISRYIGLVKSYPNTRYAAVVESRRAAEQLAQAAAIAGIRMEVYIDLNLGMGRTGIQPGDGAVDLYRICLAQDSLHIQGFHAYDGHVREVDLNKRKAICDRNFEPVSAMIDQLTAEGFPKPRIIIGGSPTFPIYAQYPDVECSPGTFVLWDKEYRDSLPEQEFLPAAVLLCRVISLPSKRRICVDLGYKAVASEKPLEQRAYFLNASDLKPVSQSEEHLVLEFANEDHGWQVGDVCYALPIHICPTVALYDKLNVIQSNRSVTQWIVVARKR